MKQEIHIAGRLWAFFRENWFKISIALLLLYAWLRKDISLQIQLASPDRQEQKAGQEKYFDATLSHIQPKTNKFENPLFSTITPQKSALRVLATIPEGDKNAYLRRFEKVAKAEERRFGIPASFILATALCQSHAGKRDVALLANNHFAIPCIAAHTEECMKSAGEYYRVYETAWAGFRDFSLLMSSRLAHLRGQPAEIWAEALEKEGWVEHPHFAESVAWIIRHFQL